MAFIASGGGVGMEWKTAPDATNYINMWEIVRALANSANEGVTVVGTIHDGGTGYAVGDFIRVADGAGDVGGTAVHPSALSGCTATFEVTSVTGGVVDAGGLRLRQSGCYSTNPDNNGTAGRYDTVKLTGSGDDALEVSLTFASPGWTESRATKELTAATIGDTVGTGYVASTSVVDVDGGDTRTGFDAPQTDNAARMTVPATLSTGQSFTVTDGGIYHRQPGTDEVATSVVSGGGDGTMTADLTFSDFSDTTTDREMILTSTDGFVVGIRTMTDGASAYNWEIMGAQSYVAANDWEAQLVQSPGRYPDDDGGSYVILENATFSYWLTVTERYIMLVANIGVGIYSNMWLGAFDKFGTDAQYPTPLAAIGCCSIHTEDQTLADNRWAGMNVCIADVTGTDGGPGSVLTPGGGWVRLRNGKGETSGGDINDDTSHLYANIIPGGGFDVTGSAFVTADEFVSGTSPHWQDFCYVEDPGSTFNDEQLITMGNAGGDEFPQLWPLTIVDTTGADPRVLGELAGAKFVDKRLDASVLNSEDEIDDGTNFYYVFNNCRLDRDWSYFAMKGA